MAEQLTAQDGRQGRRGTPALVVLIVSVGLMLAALAGLMIWQGGSSPSRLREPEPSRLAQANHRLRQRQNGWGIVGQ